MCDKERKEEEIFKAKLKKDLEEREKELDLRYRKKVEDLKNTYEKRVQLELDNEVKRRFNQKLGKKLLLERIKLEHAYAMKEKEKLKEDLERQRKELRDMFQREFNRRVQIRLNQLKEQFVHEKNNFHRKIYDEFKNKLHGEVEMNKEALKNKFHVDLINETKKRIQ